MNIIKEELQFEESIKGNKGFMCQYDKSLNFETVWSSIFEKFGKNSAIVY